MLIDVREWRRDILDEHVEELGFLWSRRLRAVRSAALDGGALWRLDRRIEAHADALALAGAHAWPLLWPLLAGDEQPAAAAATQVLARDDSDESNHKLIEALHEAPPDAQEGVRRALQLRCGARLAAVLARMTALDNLHVAAAAATVVTAAGVAVDERARGRWLAAAQPAVRRLAWLVVGRTPPAGRRDGVLAADDTWTAGMHDADPSVRWAALLAATRHRQPALLPTLRARAGQPSKQTLDEHLLFAMLAGPEDAAAVLALASAAPLEWDGFRVLVAFGGRASGPPLLRAIGAAADPVAAALAGVALTQITGIATDVPERVSLAAAGTTPEDSELADEVKRCDPARARLSWEHVLPRFDHAARLAWGHAVDALSPTRAPAKLDLEARFAVQARAAYAGAGDVRFDDELFPAARPGAG